MCASELNPQEHYGLCLSVSEKADQRFVRELETLSEKENNKENVQTSC